MSTSVVLSVLAGVLFGLALAAPPGPMNAIIAEESVVRGWVAGVIAGAGAMTADIIFFVLALAGVATVIQQWPLLRGAMVTVGGLLMLYFALDAVQSAQETLTGSDVAGESRGFEKAFVLALTNPFQILFWLTVGVAMLDPGTIDVLSHTPYVGDAAAGLVVVETGSIALLAGFFGGILVWITGFPAVLVATDNRIDSLAPVVAGASALILVGFGFLFLWDGIGTLL
ncbi:Threonine/homoserine/homoserine lactone efflux protein [Halovenus aranensis]|jgi:threonine/homoserine/homoserine lactone efflux protein|uniref:Threonine/homoserine/homoserine lactone efflux protein n=1 Tax=Halovenus aranensis TaxID=890420 RepID=A0A1G8TEH6_9EURY|nr:LysE family transporter [Halovenus aranensis]SDJ39833.1 Threonine/homoserine/homoserine lactone efflux protein [Halovenus aranensis]